MEGENPKAAAAAADWAALAEGHMEETKAATHVPRDGSLSWVGLCFILPHYELRDGPAKRDWGMESE